MPAMVISVLAANATAAVVGLCIGTRESTEPRRTAVWALITACVIMAMAAAFGGLSLLQALVVGIGYATAFFVMAPLAARLRRRTGRP